MDFETSEQNGRAFGHGHHCTVCSLVVIVLLCSSTTVNTVCTIANPQSFASRQVFKELGRTRRGEHSHDVLVGTIKMPDGKSRWATSFACAYPAKLARAYARIASCIAPHSVAARWRRLPRCMLRPRAVLSSARHRRASTRRPSRASPRLPCSRGAALAGDRRFLWRSHHVGTSALPVFRLTQDCRRRLSVAAKHVG